MKLFLSLFTSFVAMVVFIICIKLAPDSSMAVIVCLFLGILFFFSLAGHIQEELEE